ncbi:MAG: isoamylase [Treponema sp.]
MSSQESTNIDGIESDTYLSLVGGIIKSSAPKIVDKYIVFTASSSSRHVAVAFEHEKYAVLHSFRRLVPDKEAGSVLLEPVLFYIMEIPENMTKLRYRLSFDGLMTQDPLNANEEFDFENRMTVSTVTFPPRRDIRTRIIDGKSVNFVYVGVPHLKISVAGSFNNWDPFMYFMEETSEGIYELTLPLPKGTYTYSYFLGTEMKVDITNHERSYGADGKVVSVLTL